MRNPPLPFLLALALAGCSSTVLSIPSAPVGPGEVSVGAAEGSATGVMLFNLIPLGQNERFVNAYEAACRSVEADRLTDVEISESWFWAYLMNVYTFKVKGTGVKRR